LLIAALTQPISNGAEPISVLRGWFLKLKFHSWIRHLFFTCLLLGSAITAGQSSAGAKLEEIFQSGELRVSVFFEDVAPFFYTDEASGFVGIDPDLSRDMASKLGVDVTFVRNAETFDGIVDEVLEGRADVAISLLSDTLERATRVSFTNSYVSVRQFLLLNRLKFGELRSANKTGGPIEQQLNTEKAKLGVIAGTSYVGFAHEEFPRADVVEFDGWPEMLAGLKEGNLVALMYDEIEIGNWRLSDPAGAVELRAYHLASRPDTIAIAVHPDDTDLLNWINLYLKKLRDSGELEILLKNYLYTDERGLSFD
jgi:ABC-type amino acid transport substrate-binding protein